jgi:hypothetical protein
MVVKVGQAMFRRRKAAAEKRRPADPPMFSNGD